VRRIVPDGCIDVVWRADAGLLVEGPATEAMVVDLLPGSLVVGLRFRPGMAPSLLGVAADELRDRSVPLGDVWGSAGRAVTRELEDLPRRVALEVIQRVFLRRLDAAVGPDETVSAAVDRLRREPTTGVRELSTGLGVSSRQLLRRFSDRVGYGPRTFGRVARFQRFLSTAEQLRNDDRSLADLALQTGYADQAHLSRECRDLGGLPPLRLLAALMGESRRVRFVQDGR